MNQDVIEAFIDSTTSVFCTMLGVEVTNNEPAQCAEPVANGVSGIIGLTGCISGDVIICVNESFAKQATSALLGMPTTEMNEDVSDAIGELTNMIVGCAKGKLEKYNLGLSLPTVVLGSDYSIGFQKSITPIQLPFDSPWGKFQINLGLTLVDAPACV
jgi:chemotaxis protein CheX